MYLGFLDLWEEKYLPVKYMGYISDYDISSKAFLLSSQFLTRFCNSEFSDTLIEFRY